jgi:hypothetical protein
MALRTDGGGTAEYRSFAPDAAGRRELALWAGEGRVHVALVDAEGPGWLGIYRALLRTVPKTAAMSQGFMEETPGRRPCCPPSRWLAMLARRYLKRTQLWGLPASADVRAMTRLRRRILRRIRQIRRFIGRLLELAGISGPLAPWEARGAGDLASLAAEGAAAGRLPLGAFVFAADSGADDHAGACEVLELTARLMEEGERAWLGGAPALSGRDGMAARSGRDARSGRAGRTGRPGKDARAGRPGKPGRSGRPGRLGRSGSSGRAAPASSGDGPTSSEDRPATLRGAVVQLLDYYQYLRIVSLLLELDIMDGASDAPWPLSLLRSVPGIGRMRAACVIAELGPEAGRFQDAESACLWAGYGAPVGGEGAAPPSPGCGPRAGLRRLLRAAFRKAARTSPRFRALLPGGAAPSAEAVAAAEAAGERLVLKIIFDVLKTGEPYREDGEY